MGFGVCDLLFRVVGLVYGVRLRWWFLWVMWVLDTLVGLDCGWVRYSVFGMVQVYFFVAVLTVWVG